MTIAVDHLLKQHEDNRVAANETVVIDRLGGALKLKSGRIVRDGTQIDYIWGTCNWAGGTSSLRKRLMTETISA